MPKPVGRPKIKLSDLPKDWKKKTLELAAEGASDVEIRAEALNCIAFETWDRLLKEEPEFFETIKEAATLCENWWRKKGRVSLENKDFNYVGWYMNMKNRFGWRDKHDHTTDGKPLTITTVNYADTDSGVSAEAISTAADEGDRQREKEGSDSVAST